MRRVIDEMHLPELTIVYGLTETSPGLTQTLRDADLVERTQTVGRVLSEIALRIVDLCQGEEICYATAGHLPWGGGWVGGQGLITGIPSPPPLLKRN